MSERKGLLSSALGMLACNKRYICWFWFLNLTLAEFGTEAFRKSAHAVLDHSLYANGLLHGFNLSVFGDLLARPEFGQMSAMESPALYFACLFFVATALFLPGVFQGYASTYRLPRDDFFRACGRNMWRFIRLMILAGIIMGIIAGLLFSLNAAIFKKAGESTNEVLGFELNMTGLFVIFLIMTILRIWFDLAETDVVLNNQRAVLKSIALAFRHTFGSLGRLLASYFVITVVAAIILVGGIWMWIRFIPSDSIWRAFLLAQIILLLLLIPRFWQRGVAVSYWQQYMMVPVTVVEPVIVPVVPSPVLSEPPAPVVPVTPAEAPGT
jgi:hypothetical protein